MEARERPSKALSPVRPQGRGGPPHAMARQAGVAPGHASKRKKEGGVAMLSPERFQEIFDRVIELVYDNDAITVREIRVKLQSEFGNDARTFEREVAGINTLLNDAEG